MSPVGKVAHQEWNSARDVSDKETTTAPLLNRERNVVREERSPTPQARSTHPAKETRSTPTLTILSTYREPETASQFRWWHAVISGFLLLLFVGLLGIGAWYWWLDGGSGTRTSSNPTAASKEPSIAPSTQPTSTITPGQPTMPRTADEEIEDLRERRIVAKPSETIEIISALEQAEKKFPNDYRFPFELSKLSIKGSTSHREAFEPLARAVQKAIDNDQADEMLNRLMADKYGDFHKLSHGHHEWEAIEQALRNKDKGVLKTGTH